jgi:plasmid stabilization system protein ParE
MTTRYVIEFADSAVLDLDEIYEWYVEQQVPETGLRLIAEIVTRTSQLETFPESGRIVPELGVANIRELIYPPFRIVYRLDEDHIWLIRVWRSERLMKVPV